jgi:hypothetical protein
MYCEYTFQIHCKYQPILLISMVSLRCYTINSITHLQAQPQPSPPLPRACPAAACRTGSARLLHCQTPCQVPASAAAAAAASEAACCPAQHQWK